MKRKVIWTKQFKKDYILAIKRGFPITKLDELIRLLASSDVIPSYYKDHELFGNWAGFRECHIQSDWLLIYKIYNNNLILSLTRTGSHSDLFK